MADIIANLADLGTRYDAAFTAGFHHPNAAARPALSPGGEQNRRTGKPDQTPSFALAQIHPVSRPFSASRPGPAGKPSPAQIFRRKISRANPWSKINGKPYPIVKTV